MLAVGLSAGAARELIGADAERVQAAAINSPQLVTLAGDTEPLERLAARLEQAGTFHRWLRIAYAFHTHQMEPIRDELLQALADLAPRAARIPFVSTVTQDVMPGQEMDASYWWRNVRQPVLFGPAISRLVREQDAMFLELGPHPALESPLKECLAEQGRAGPIFHSLRRETDESQEMLANLAALHLHGVPLDWTAVNQSQTFVPLPRYPWNYETFWLETEPSVHSRLTPFEHPLLGLRTSAPQPTWQFDLDPRRLAYLNEHRVWDSIIIPAAAYGEIGLAVARALFPNEPHAVEDLEMKKALFVGPAEARPVQVVCDPADKTFAVYSRPPEQPDWEFHAHGRLTRLVLPDPPPVDVQQLRQPLREHFDHEAYYRQTAKIGYQFGPSFRELQNIWRIPGEALAEITVPDSVAESSRAYHFHPAVLDACLHVTTGLRVVAEENVGEGDFYLPESVRRIHLYRDKPPTHLWSHARLLRDDGQSLLIDILVYDNDGRRVADILGFRVQHVEQQRAADDLDQCCYQFAWEPRRLRATRVTGSCNFPAPAEIAAAARDAVPEIYRTQAVDQYQHAYRPRVDVLVGQLVQNAYLELGWRPSVGDRFTAGQLIAQLGIAEPHHRLTRSHLRNLAHHGLLRSAGEDAWEVVRCPRPTDVTSELAALAADFPRFAPDHALLERTGPHLTAVLAGEVDSSDLLFPGGSPAAAEWTLC